MHDKGQVRGGVVHKPESPETSSRGASKQNDTTFGAGPKFGAGLPTPPPPRPQVSLFVPTPFEDSETHRTLPPCTRRSCIHAAHPPP